MEGLNHRRNTEKKRQHKRNQLHLIQVKRGMSSASTQSTKTSDIHNESIDKQMEAKAHETAQNTDLKTKQEVYLIMQPNQSVD